MNKVDKLYKERQAHLVLGKALRKGLIQVDVKCFACGSEQNIVAHLMNYNEPTKVAWMCRSCHQALHGLLKKRNINPKGLEEDERSCLK